MGGRGQADSFLSDMSKLPKDSILKRLMAIEMPAESLKKVLIIFEEYTGPQAELSFSGEIPGGVDPIKARINALYKRRPSTPWSQKEQSSYRRAQIAEEDLQIVERARQLGYLYYRKDIFTLLNNWNSEVDRSRNFILDESTYHHAE